MLIADLLMCEILVIRNNFALKMWSVVQWAFYFEGGLVWDKFIELMSHENTTEQISPEEPLVKHWIFFSSTNLIMIMIMDRGRYEIFSFLGSNVSTGFFQSWSCITRPVKISHNGIPRWNTCKDCPLEDILRSFFFMYGCWRGRYLFLLISSSFSVFTLHVF